MSDQGKWWKLWCSSLRDDDLENLSIHEWFCWARFGAHIKENGKDGKLRLRAPATAVVNLLRVPNFDEAVSMLKRFPNYVVTHPVLVTPDVTITVEVKVTNWNKYQGDWSRDRVRKYRKAVTSNVTAQEEKRREVEEKRKEEKRITPSATDGRVKVLIDIFFAGLSERAGEKPIFNGGEAGKAIKALLVTYNQQEIHTRMVDWFASTDPFVAKVGWRFSEFHKNFNKLKEGPIHAYTSKPANAFVATAGESSKYDRK